MVINANAVDGLKQLSNESVDCIITSPPYYQLRKYGDSHQELGQEDSPQKYIQNLMDVFTECYRVLKKDGTLFINISDTYNSTIPYNKNDELNMSNVTDYTFRKNYAAIKRKSLMGIPSRLEIAMIDSGWILRNEIIWHKPNCMPSSVKDRFTVDYEKIFFFTKSEKYYFNQLKEKMKTLDTTSPRGSKGALYQLNKGLRLANKYNKEVSLNKQDALGKGTYTGFNERYKSHEGLMRNKRTVWTIPTESSTIEHFAMYPKELVETLLECGAKQGGVVMDPFAGAGTTLKVAKYLGYEVIGIELYQKNCEIIEERLSKTPIQSTLF